MAKRRKLEAPSAEALSEIEAEFRRETSPRNAAAPITQVAAEAAALANPLSADERAQQIRDQADAAELSEARDEGRLIAAIATREIDADAMVRDRSLLDQAEMIELRSSIAAHGLRLPIELFELGAPGADGARYGLLSGYRRLKAVQALHELTGDAAYTKIKALIRPRSEVDDAFVAMVEENEVRSDLSHFERGRIAVIAAQGGAFVNVEEAVGKLFASGSKAKRSKIRSFAMVFEELGDILEFPEDLTEKQGLRLATALRSGAEPRLRAALEDPASSASEEWAALEAALAQIDPAPANPARGGRPAKKKPKLGWSDGDTLRTSAGITIRKGHDGEGYLLRFEGRGLDSELMDSLMMEIRALLERP